MRPDLDTAAARLVKAVASLQPIRTRPDWQLAERLQRECREAVDESLKRDRLLPDEDGV